MKKLLTCFLAVLFAGAAALCFTGCEKNYGLSPSNPAHLTLWHYYNGAQRQSFAGAVNEFNDTVGAEKGITVDLLPMGSVNDIAANVIASAKGDVGALALPDIFSAYADTCFQMDKLNLLVNFADFMSKEELQEYVADYLAEGSFRSDREYKIFPIAKASEVLAVNYTDWSRFAAETGVTEEGFKTWEGIAAMAEKYYAWSGGKALFGRDAFANYMIVGSKQLGAPILTVENNRGSFHFDGAVLKKLWDNFYVPYVKGYYSHGNTRFRTDDIKSGALLAYVGSTSAVTYFPSNVDNEKDPIHEIQAKVYPVPNFSGTVPHAVQQGAGMAVVKSDNRTAYAATIFLKWFTEYGRNLQFSVESGYLPVKNTANTQAAIDETVAGFPGGSPISPLVEQTLRIGVQTVGSSVMYTTKAFDGGTEAREILENSMIDLARSDRAAVLAGTQTLEECLRQAHFEAWVNALKNEFENLKTDIEQL